MTARVCSRVPHWGPATEGLLRPQGVFHPARKSPPLQCQLDGCLASDPGSGILTARTSLSAPSKWMHAAFLSMESATTQAGSPLPESAYSVCVAHGKDEPPQLHTETMVRDMQGFLLVARDEDSPSDPPLWAVANISPLDNQSLNSPRLRQEAVVVPYHGPDPQDSFIHRIIFRLYPLVELVPRQYLGNWPKLQGWMQAHDIGVVKDPDAPVDWAEFLSTAVARQRNPLAPAWCAAPSVAGAPVASVPSGSAESTGSTAGAIGTAVAQGAPSGRYAWEHGGWARADWVGRETLPLRPTAKRQGLGGYMDTGVDPEASVGGVKGSIAAEMSALTV